ncbi:hypothetical protein K431DRAFT_284924 [Polychaeton citri CBS 116435]|uniref:Uncharacterized protein n=1 Tax=Polychaeton citri CBS 116435 TaxID=1314669 RepID=A0A9P4Q661_9PEZI|nr:hypothetical protein K431DRAFT_284924 [Polychaeton citri CBS 116435]
MIVKNCLLSGYTTATLGSVQGIKPASCRVREPACSRSLSASVLLIYRACVDVNSNVLRLLMLSAS